MALTEIDEYWVSRELWTRVQHGEHVAIETLRAAISNMQLYMHALSVRSDEIPVTLRQLEQARIIRSIRVESDDDRSPISWNEEQQIRRQRAEQVAKDVP